MVNPSHTWKEVNQQKWNRIVSHDPNPTPSRQCGKGGAFFILTMTEHTAEWYRQEHFPSDDDFSVRSKMYDLIACAGQILLDSDAYAICRPNSRDLVLTWADLYADPDLLSFKNLYNMEGDTFRASITASLNFVEGLERAAQALWD